MRFSIEFWSLFLSDEHAEPVYTCPSCGNVGFALDHTKILGNNGKTSESCRVCGIPDFLSKYPNNEWHECWKENGSRNVFELPLTERIEYADHIYDCMYRKEYIIPSEEDVKAKRLDRRIFTDNDRDLPFVKDDSKLTITNDKGEKWEFPYETNRIFELDNDKRYVMLIEECGYTRLLASDHLGVRESPRLSYPGLTPDLFTFIGLFEPDCTLEDRDGVIYTASVAKYKREYVFEDDDFHKKVSSLVERINNIINDLPKKDFRNRGILTYCIMELESMDRRGDPSRFMPHNLISILEERPDTFKDNPGPISELYDELKETVRDYEALKRG